MHFRNFFLQKTEFSLVFLAFFTKFLQFPLKIVISQVNLRCFSLFRRAIRIKQPNQSCSSIFRSKLRKLEAEYTLLSVYVCVCVCVSTHNFTFNWFFSSIFIGFFAFFERKTLFFCLFSPVSDLWTIYLISIRSQVDPMFRKWSHWSRDEKKKISCYFERKFKLFRVSRWINSFFLTFSVKFKLKHHF